MLKEVKDLFILEAYFSLSPAVRVDFCFYEPARSTKCIFEVLIEKLFSLLYYYFFYFVVIKSVSIE